MSAETPRILTRCFECGSPFYIDADKFDRFFLHTIQCGKCEKPISIDSLAWTVANQQKEIAHLRRADKGESHER